MKRYREIPEVRNAVKARAKKWKEENRERCRELEREWRQKNDDKYRAGQKERNRRARLRRHGITAEYYDSLFTSQNGVCAICHKKKSRLLSIDHKHSNGAIRGLLCHHCNAGLGQFFEDRQLLMAAIEYLDFHDSIPADKLVFGPTGALN